MNDYKHRNFLLLIASLVVIIITVQLYWNYKNYNENKRQLVNEIQISFDNSIEEYYAALAKENYLTITSPEKIKKRSFDSIVDNLKNIKAVNMQNGKTSISVTDVSISDSENKNKNSDSLFINVSKGLLSNDVIDALDFKDSSGKINVYNDKKTLDSLSLLSSLKPSFISFVTESISYKKLDSLLQLQFLQKKIDLKYSIIHLKSDIVTYNSNKNIFIGDKLLNVNSKSTFLKKNEQFQLSFIDPSFLILKKGFLGILLSFLLSLAVALSLFYLLYVIKNQKQISQIKEDFISNITHEFKTPITTIGVALEGLQEFENIKNDERSNRYIDVSNRQLKKLNLMVEKLLDISTFDNYTIKKEYTDILIISEELINDYNVNSNNTEIKLIANCKSIVLKIDSFQISNAINNLIDNAVKYGGDEIIVELFRNEEKTLIKISDSGTILEQKHKSLIFEKFYRVSTGNVHDIKGYGIGLYYSKEVIEKHNGTLDLELKNDKTTFKIILPNE
jgi:signal transduction histidine kinase